MSITYKYHSADCHVYDDNQNVPTNFNKCGRRLQYGDLCTIVTTTELEGIETGKLIGKYVDGVFVETITMHDIGDNTYVYGRFQITDNVAYQQKEFNVGYGYSYIKLSDYKDIINKIIRDGVIFDPKNFNVFIFKSNIMRSEHNHMFEGKQLYIPNFYNNPKKVSNRIDLVTAGIIDKETAKIIEDEYTKHIINKKLQSIENEIANFLQTQTTFDDVTKFIKLQETLNV